MKKINKSKLNALMMESLKLKYPNMPEAYIPKTEWNDNKGTYGQRLQTFQSNA